LQAEGELTYEIAGRDRPLETWIEEFLRLEASGWKGRAGTAFADTQSDRELFIETMRQAHAEGRLMGLGMYLNGRPVALKANLTCESGGAFAFKICYDEAFARFSPGVLLELENIRELHRRGIQWMDSCADEDHPMISRLWPGRREIRMLYLARPWISRGLAALCRTKRAAGRRLRAKEKQSAAPRSEGERMPGEAHTVAAD
jgi:hypothetical protein